MNEDLRDWFGSGPKGGKGGGGWDRYNFKGERVGKCARDDKDGDGIADGPKPKCLSNEKAAKMSKKERAAAVRRKRAKDPVADRPGKGGKPIMSSNKIKEEQSPMVRKILEKIECENEWVLVEKNVPTNPSLWAKFKSQAKSKFDVYPSAYANGWAAKKYKAAGGSWKKASAKSEEVELEDGIEVLEEAVTIRSRTGNVYMVSFMFRGKFMLAKVFFPNPKRPSRDEVQFALDKIYPGAKVQRFDLTHINYGDTYLNAGEVKEDVEEVEEGAAWTKKAGKNPEGGLNEKGRKSYERENPGSDLKRPQPEGGPRKRSFCARMGGMKGPMKDEKGRPTRKALALRKWKC